MKVGDNVLITTPFGGMYNGKTGVIVPDDGDIPSGFVRVRFNEPIRTESREFRSDIFLLQELKVVEGGENK